MSYSSFIEQVHDEIVDFVWEELPAMLRSLEEIDADDVKLPMLEQKLIGDYDLNNLQLFPGLILKPGAVTVNPEGEPHPFTKDLLVFNMSFWVVTKGADMDVLQRQCDRYGWALKKIIDDPDISPTQATLVGALRNVTMIDFHESVKVGMTNVSAVFVDVTIKTYSDR